MDVEVQQTQRIYFAVLAPQSHNEQRFRADFNQTKHCTVANEKIDSLVAMLKFQHGGYRLRNTLSLSGGLAHGLDDASDAFPALRMQRHDVSIRPTGDFLIENLRNWIFWKLH